MHSPTNPEAEPIEAAIYGSVYVPDFPAQACIRNEPELRRCPVAVLDPVFPLFAVVATNGLARQIGVRNGMTRIQLDQFSDVRVRFRSRPQEESAHETLLDCARSFTPRIEDTATDTLTLDLSGLSGLWGSSRAIAQKLFQATGRLGLEAHVAIASNPDAAIHAARAKTGLTVITPGDEAVKLMPLPLDVLSPSDELTATFHRWGLQTFKDLARLPEARISERLGQEGVQLQRMARGETRRPLYITKEKPSFKESLELEHFIDSIEPLRFIIGRLLDSLCKRLSARNRATQTLHLELTLEGELGRSTARFQRTLRVPVPVRNPKILLKLLQLDLENHRPPAPVVGVALRAEPVEPRSIQNGLFFPQTPEPEKLELTLSRIGNIVGSGSLGSPVPLDTHRRHAFNMKQFNAPPINTPLGPSNKRSDTSPERAFRSERTFRNGRSALAAMRIARPAQPITVEMDRQRPGRILFAGKTGKVVAAAGPWNASGDWWRKDAWSREEWDVEVEIGWRRTLYRIYRDPRRDCWFIDATYD